MVRRIKFTKVITENDHRTLTFKLTFFFNIITLTNESLKVQIGNIWKVQSEMTAKSVTYLRK